MAARKQGEVLSGATLRDMGWSDRDVLLQVTLRTCLVGGDTQEKDTGCRKNNANGILSVREGR